MLEMDVYMVVFKAVSDHYKRDIKIREIQAQVPFVNVVFLIILSLL